MSKYDRITALDFFKEIPKRFDGKIAIFLTAATIVIALIAPFLDLSLGKNKGYSLSIKLIAFIPAFLLYYVSLVYYSRHGRISTFINSLLLLAVPVLFIYLSK